MEHRLIPLYLDIWKVSHLDHQDRCQMSRDLQYAFLDQGLGLKMHTVNLCSSGIDLDDLNEKLSKCPNIKGLICVPRHSNPSGEVFSDENITNLLKTTKEYNSSLSYILW